MMKPQRLGLAGTRDDGFTLLEAMVVLLLISSALVAFTYIANPVRFGSNLTTVTMEMATVLRSARSEAVAGNREVAFVFDSHLRRYQIVPGSFNRPVPEALNITVTAARLRNQSQGQSQIIFFGDGSSTGGSIEISQNQAVNSIHVGWLTGGISITEHD